MGKGEGDILYGRGGSRIFKGGVALGVTELMGHASKMLQFENWNLIDHIRILGIGLELICN